jgi:hypothetical protein
MCAILLKDGIVENMSAVQAEINQTELDCFSFPSLYSLRRE